MPKCPKRCTVSSVGRRSSLLVVSVAALLLPAAAAHAQDAQSAEPAGAVTLQPSAAAKVVAETVTVEPEKLDVWLNVEVSGDKAQGRLDSPPLNLNEIFGMEPVTPPDGDNLIGLQVAVDNAAVSLAWSSAAKTPDGDDVTGQLKSARLPLSPFDKGLEPALNALDPASSGRLAAVKAVSVVQGMDMPLPNWVYQATAAFPLPKGAHALSLSYRGQEGISMLFPGLAKDEEDYRGYYKDNFCFDPQQDKDVQALVKAAADPEQLALSTREIAYRPALPAGQVTVRVAGDAAAMLVRGCGMDFAAVQGGVQASAKVAPELRLLIIDSTPADPESGNAE